MLKTLFGRKGKEANTFWKMAGCTLPPLAEGLGYVWLPEGALIEGVLTLAKGPNVIELPAPVLGNHCLLVLGIAPGLLQTPGVKAELPLGVLGAHTASLGPIVLKIASKEAVAYEGSILSYYLLSSR